MEIIIELVKYNWNQIIMSLANKSNRVFNMTPISKKGISDQIYSHSLIDQPLVV